MSEQKEQVEAKSEKVVAKPAVKRTYKANPKAKKPVVKDEVEPDEEQETPKVEKPKGNLTKKYVSDFMSRNEVRITAAALNMLALDGNEKRLAMTVDVANSRKVTAKGGVKAQYTEGKRITVGVSDVNVASKYA